MTRARMLRFTRHYKDTIQERSVILLSFWFWFWYRFWYRKIIPNLLELNVPKIIKTELSLTKLLQNEMVQFFDSLCRTICLMTQFASPFWAFTNDLRHASKLKAEILHIRIIKTYFCACHFSLASYTYATLRHLLIRVWNLSFCNTLSYWLAKIEHWIWCCITSTNVK